MRKPFMVTLASAAILYTSLLVQAQSATTQNYESGRDTSRYRLPAAQAKAIIEGRAREVLLALKSKDMARLSTFVHPQRGLRLSTYAYVDRDDKWLSRGQVRTLFNNNRRSVWFKADESGEPMRMTARKYFDDYIYDNDYLAAREVYYNTQYKRGITIPNVLDFYPRAIVVEYYDPGNEPNQRGWDTLWLVFEKSGRTWYLVGIVKDSPTI